MASDLRPRCRDALRRLHEQGRIASPWMAGMLAVFSDGIRERYELGDGPWTYGDRCPDPTDPATRGCLLALVREASGQPKISLVYCEPVYPDQACGWALQWADSRLPLWGSDYETEAEALAALEALAGGEG
jgi:hypothetical protein